MTGIYLWIFLWASPILQAVAVANGDILLRNYPLIMTHDAATGELVEDRDHIVADWAKTQSVGLGEQLKCGARSFDYRPKLEKDGTIYAHHGGVTIRKPMQESVADILSWNGLNPDEFVMLYISHTDGDNCTAAVESLLASMKVPYTKDCTALNTWTYSHALDVSSLPSGGHLLAIFDCVDEQYDESIECYVDRDVCYEGDTLATKGYQKLISYMNALTNSPPSTLYMVQAHWQSSVSSVAKGTLHRSSLLLDESKSGVNAYVAQQIRAKAYPNMGLLEVDNVCDGGSEILQAIREVYLK
eukprot:gene25438-30717_t